MLIQQEGMTHNDYAILLEERNIITIFEEHPGMTSPHMKHRDAAYKEIGKSVLELIRLHYPINVKEEHMIFLEVLLEHADIVTKSTRKRERERSLIRMGRCAEILYLDIKYPNWEKESSDVNAVKKGLDAEDVRYGTFYGLGRQQA